MNATPNPMALAAGGRTIAIRGGDAAAIRGRIADVLGLDSGEVGVASAGGAAAGALADVLVVADLNDGGADIDLASAVAPSGHLLLPADDAMLRRQGALSHQQQGPRVLWYGRAAACDIAATDIAFADGCLRFRIGQQWFQASAWSRSSLKEVLAAVAVARIFCVPLAQAAERLAGSPPISSRRQVSEASSVTLIHDAGRVTAARLGPTLDLLREFPGAGRRIVCYGEAHHDEGDIHGPLAEAVVSRCGADELVACGPGAWRLTEAARAAGLPARSAIACGEASDAARRLAAMLKPGDVLLVLGEPVESMSQLVEYIRDAAVAPAAFTHVPVGELADPFSSLPQFMS